MKILSEKKIFLIYTGQNKLGIKLLRMHFGSIDN